MFQPLKDLKDQIDFNFDNSFKYTSRLALGMMAATSVLLALLNYFVPLILSVVFALVGFYMIYYARTRVEVGRSQ